MVAVDLRGHGQSDKPQLEYTLELFAGDIAAICGDLKLEHLILVGHSMGGTIALEVATRYPDLLSGIVLIDTVLQPDAKLRDALKAMYENLLNGFLGNSRARGRREPSALCSELICSASHV